MKVLLVDNYDSFTYMLKDYVEQNGARCDVIRNDSAGMHTGAEGYDAILISPGPSSPERSGSLMSFLKEHAHKKPILGVCLGHQAIGQLFGAKLVKADIPRHGKQDEVFHNNDELYSSIPSSFIATRYHSLILQDLPADLELNAWTSSHEIMGIKHRSLPLWGIQFHPESCLTEKGINIIQNFLLMARAKY